MDLRTRLARLDRLSRRPHETVKPIDATLPVGDEHVHALCRELGLAKIHPQKSGLFQRQRLFACPQPDFIGSDLVGLFSFTPASGLKATDLLFLDVETTGLSGGTGTLAFLVGLGWWVADGFMVAQAFITDPECEGEMLAWISDIADNFQAVVTFNGATFDLPLLRTRALLNRHRGFLAGMESLDLIVPARRFWRRTLPDCRQQTLENLICKLERGPGDIPGCEIPAVWFSFLRGEGPVQMASVLRHNERDIHGMAMVWHQLLRWTRIADGREFRDQDWPQMTWSQSWSLARVAQARGQGTMVDHWLEQTLDLMALTHKTEKPEVSQASGFWNDVTCLAKRRKNIPILERILGQALALGPHVAWLHREAAIMYEYRMGDLATALVHATQSGEPRRVARLEARILRWGRASTVVVKN